MPIQINAQNEHWATHIMISFGWLSVLVEAKEIPEISYVKVYTLHCTAPPIQQNQVYRYFG